MATTAHGTIAAARSVNDAVLNSTTTVTSAAANFVAGDVGRLVTATGIPVGTTIASVTDEATVVPSAAATASGSGVTMAIGVTVATVTVTNGLTVKNRATTAVDFDFVLGTTAPAEPVVSAAGTYKLSGTVLGQTAKEFTRDQIPGAPKNGSFDVIVKMVSAGTPAYSVEAW